MLSRQTHATAADPNPSVLQDEILAVQAKHTVTLYNPRPDWFQFEAGGRTYVMPPDLDGRLIDHLIEDDKSTGKPVKVVADGTLRVSAQMGKFGEGSRHKLDIIPYPKNGTERGPHGDGGRYMMVPSADAAFVAGVAIRNYGNTGITWLPDDEVIAASKRRGSKEVYKNWRRTSAKKILDDWNQDLAKFQSIPANKGKSLPRPGALIIRAQEELDSFAADEAAVGGEVFTCDHCGYFSGDP